MTSAQPPGKPNVPALPLTAGTPHPWDEEEEAAAADAARKATVAAARRHGAAAADDDDDFDGPSPPQAKNGGVGTAATGAAFREDDEDEDADEGEQPGHKDGGKGPLTTKTTATTLEVSAAGSESSSSTTTNNNNNQQQQTQQQTKPKLLQSKVAIAPPLQAIMRPVVKLKRLNMDKISKLSKQRPRNVPSTARSHLEYMKDNIYETTTPAQIENLRLEATDPFIRNRPKGNTNRRIFVLSFVVVTLASLAMVFICLGFDAASVSWEPPRGDGTVEEPDFKHYTVYAMIYAMLNPTPDQSRSVLQSVINMMAFIFGLLVTIIGITLQFAADRTTKHVQALFFQDKFILSVLGFSLLGNAFVTWVYLELGDLHSPRIAVVLSVIISNVQFVLLFPFLSYLFVFLEPEKVANNLMESGLNAAIQSINASGLNDKQIIFNQVQTTLSIEYLMDAAISSIKKRQRNVSAEIVDALCSFCMHYLFYIKDNAPPNWFFIPTSMQQSPDFLILSSISIQELTDRKLWVEWKVLRQYQTLFNEALRLFTETCYHVSINTRIIGETAAIKAQTRVVDLVIKFFNTYLRAGINATSTNPNAVKVVYNCMFQYRHFAESLLDKSVVTEEIARRAIRIAKYQRYYAHFCHTKGLGFLVETVSHDLRLLCEFAFREIKALHPTDPPLAFLAATHEKLLGVFLSISDFNFDKMEQKRGILQSQIILATFYLAEGNYGAARRILVSADRQENKINLLSLKEELMGPTTKEFWEVSERATNFNYLEPARKDQLETLYEMFSFDPTTSDVTDYMHSPEGKKLKVLQEVTKFDDEIVETKADSDEEVPDEEEYELAAGNL